MLYCFYYIMSYYIIVCFIILYYILYFVIIFYYIILLYFIRLYYILIYYIILYIILYHIILYHIYDIIILLYFLIIIILYIYIYVSKCLSLATAKGWNPTGSPQVAIPQKWALAPRRLDRKIWEDAARLQNASIEITRNQIICGTYMNVLDFKGESLLWVGWQWMT